MSNDNGNNSPPNDNMVPNRRGSVSSAAFANLFHRSNSTSTGSHVGAGPNSVAAQARDSRRRLSVTTLGLSGTSGPTSAATPFGFRRGSISTSNSDSIDENAVDDELDAARTAPTTPFTRRMSYGASAMRSMRGGGTSPSDQGFNWSEQLRSRAESSVSGMRPTFGAASSPPRSGNGTHDRAKSVSDMPAPPQQAAALKPKQSERPKPDHMQERILKGDFYMD